MMPVNKRRVVQPFITPRIQGDIVPGVRGGRPFTNLYSVAMANCDSKTGSIANPSSGTSSTDTTNQMQGAGCIKVITTAPNAYFSDDATSRPVIIPGQWYTFRCMMKGNAGGEVVTFTPVYRNLADSTITPTIPTASFTLTTDWREYKMIIPEAPALAYKIRMNIYVAVASTIYVDTCGLAAGDMPYWIAGLSSS